MDLGDRGVEVVEDRHEGDADASLGCLRAEVGEPPVVRLRARERELGRVAGTAGEAGPERGCGDAAGPEHVGVGEEHFRGHAFDVQDLVAVVGLVGGGETSVATGLLFPLPLEVGVVARAARLGHGVAHADEGCLVLVERGAVLGVEVLPVVLRRGSGVPVRRDHEVVGAHQRPFPPSTNVVRKLYPTCGD